MQLSAKALLKPFNTAISGMSTDDDAAVLDGNDGVVIDKDDKDQEEDEDKSESDIEDGNIKKLQELSEDEQIQMLEETAVVCETVTKVCTQ